MEIKELVIRLREISPDYHLTVRPDGAVTLKSMCNICDIPFPNIEDFEKWVLKQTEPQVGEFWRFNNKCGIFKILWKNNMQVFISRRDCHETFDRAVYIPHFIQLAEKVQG